MTQAVAERVVPDLIKDAAQRGTPLEAMLRLLVESLADSYPATKGKFTLAGYGGRLELLQREGGCVDTKEAAFAYQGHNPSKNPKAETVRRAARESRIVAARDGHGDLLFPVWQFRPDGGLLPGLQDALDILSHRPGYSEITPFVFFLQPHPVTEGTPLDALRAGRVEAVLAAAKCSLD